MATRSKLLSHVQVAAPCNASWNDMQGTDRIRFCNECKLNVYNLSAMSAKEAEKLIIEKEGKLCARFFRRTDGTILTENCPVGLRNLRRTIKLARIAAAFFFSWLISTCRTESQTAETEFVSVQKSNIDTTCVDTVLVVKKQLQDGRKCGPCNPLKTSTKSQSLVFADTANMVRQHEDILELNYGKVVVLTKHYPEKIQFQYATITIPAKSCAIFEARPESQYLRVASLAGTDMQIFLKNETRTYKLIVDSGEELLVSPSPNTKNEPPVIPDDGVYREPIMGGLGIPGFSRRANVIDNYELLEKQSLLACSITKGSNRAVRRLISSLRNQIFEEYRGRLIHPFQKPIMQIRSGEDHPNKEQ